jgi:outer membrane protein TolC
MTARPNTRWRAPAWGLALLLALAAVGRGGELPPPTPVPAAPVTPVLGPDSAVVFALQNNPEIATLRRQHGIAAAGVVIARTYPFNPLAQHFVMGVNGPAESGVTNHVFNEHTMRLDLELRHQGTHRRALARSTLSRVDWEIAAQEVGLALRVARAFNALLYRRGKLQILDETIQFQATALRQVEELVGQNRLTRADLVLAQADAAEARTARGPAAANAVTATYDLRRLLGVIDEPVEADGTLERDLPRPGLEELVQAALERRPDLHALELAVAEADARLRLEIANRFGNPSLGPAYEFNETSDHFIGMWLVWQVPIFNTRQGEIQMRQAERDRALAAVRQAEVQIQQDVRAALARLGEAEVVVETFRTRTLPTLRRAREELDRLFAENLPGGELSRVIDIRRRLLRARDAYLDALWELNQARADLATAVGDPSLAYAPFQDPPPGPGACPAPSPQGAE